MGSELTSVPPPHAGEIEHLGPLLAPGGLEPQPGGVGATRGVLPPKQMHQRCEERICGDD